MSLSDDGTDVVDTTEEEPPATPEPQSPTADRRPPTADFAVGDVSDWQVENTRYKVQGIKCKVRYKSIRCMVLGR